MVRALYAMPRDGNGRLDRAGHGHQLPDRARLVFIFLLFGLTGCAVVPRSRMDECQKVSQALRGDNARLKDRVLALQGQNRDYAERAVDDAKRLAIQDEALERLEHSVQAYQDERTRLEAAYKRLSSNLSVAERETDGERIDVGARATRAERPGSPASARNSSTNTGVDAATPR
jgi:septal ring factor EnvC (AmiA/AmiB activator)